jgi:hypothetical protein
MMTRNLRAYTLKAMGDNDTRGKIDDGQIQSVFHLGEIDAISGEPLTYLVYGVKDVHHLSKGTEITDHFVNEYRIRLIADHRAGNKHRDLPVLDRIGIGHAKDGETGEMGTQDAGAFMQSLERNHQDENAFHHQPTVSVFQEHRLHPAIRDGADLGVIRRIQIQQREGFGPRNRVEGIPLNGLNASSARNSCTFGVEFDTLAPNLRVAGDEMQRSSLSNAGVDH